MKEWWHTTAENEKLLEPPEAERRMEPLLPAQVGAVIVDAILTTN